MSASRSARVCRKAKWHRCCQSILARTMPRENIRCWYPNPQTSSAQVTPIHKTCNRLDQEFPRCRPNFLKDGAPKGRSAAAPELWAAPFVEAGVIAARATSKQVQTTERILMARATKVRTSACRGGAPNQRFSKLTGQKRYNIPSKQLSPPMALTRPPTCWKPYRG